MVVNVLRKYLQECLRCGLSISDVSKEVREDDGVPGCPFSKLLWFFQVEDGGSKEYLCCWEADLLAISRKSALDVNQYHSWRL